MTGRGAERQIRGWIAGVLICRQGAGKLNSKGERGLKKMAAMKTSKTLKLLMRSTTNLFSSLSIGGHDLMHECKDCQDTASATRNFPE